ncbi:cupredoxin domain-containing protein [Natronococcus wangiae]|uniref:hypothetical protein n=1 Tax=Natronococcus wangiae TaxID=3068275 RepID=UPI00273F9DF1|nr:hypothetical protein [Natronococcus sp. AD5]
MAPNVANRRAFLSGVAATLATASLAGCLGDDDEDESDGNEPELIVDEAESLEGDTDPDTWRDVEEIRFDAYVGGWVGVEPSHIDRVQNPTLVLFEDRPYEITWENRDNVKHNLAIYDAEEEVVDEYVTDVVADAGATETLAFTATAEMSIYICEHQPGIQRGDIEIVDDDGVPVDDA